MAKYLRTDWMWGRQAFEWWLPCAVITLAGCGGGGITTAPTETPTAEWQEEATSEEAPADPAVTEFTFEAAPSASASSDFGPILVGRTQEADRSYHVGDWLNRTAKRELRSVEVVDDTNRSYQCQVVSGLGVGDYNSEVRVHIWFRPSTRGKHTGNLKFTWATVPSSGTPTVKTGKTGIKGCAAKLQIDGLTTPSSASRLRGGTWATFMPQDTVGVKLSAFPSNATTKLPDRSLNMEWSYVDGTERRLTSGWTASVTDSRLTRLNGGIAKADPGFAARRGRDFTTGSNVANPAIGIRFRATLTLAGASETVEVSPSESGAYAFVQDTTDRLRQEYWDFNQNPRSRSANYRLDGSRWTYLGDRVDYVIPDRKDIGRGQSVYGVEITKNRSRFDASFAALRGKVPGVTVNSRFRNPRAELAATDAADTASQTHPLGALPYSARIYGNAYDVASTPAITAASASLGWSNREPQRTGGKSTFISAPGDLVLIGF